MASYSAGIDPQYFGITGELFKAPMEVTRGKINAVGYGKRVGVFT